MWEAVAVFEMFALAGLVDGSEQKLAGSCVVAVHASSAHAEVGGICRLAILAIDH
jgi:hypothetical protein